ncbi:hypothetical protein HanIR_Chr02g0089051 [Helianthus annuus]|nr:hypothetical protein HanIR_Chr02g0089051 [Helianthus annuus]
MDYNDCFSIRAIYFLIFDIKSNRSKIIGGYKSGRSTMKRGDSIDKAKIIKIEDFKNESSEETESDMSMKILNGGSNARMRNNNNIQKGKYQSRLKIRKRSKVVKIRKGSIVKEGKKTIVGGKATKKNVVRVTKWHGIHVHLLTSWLGLYE